GRPEEFAGWVGDSPARLLLYDDALVVLPDSGDAEKVPYAFIRGVTVDWYRLAVQVAGHAPLPVHRLASRTTEFTDLPGARCRASSPGAATRSRRTSASTARRAARSDPGSRACGRPARSRPDRPASMVRTRRWVPRWRTVCSASAARAASIRYRAPT